MSKKKERKEKILIQQVYFPAYRLSNYIWDTVLHWNSFNKRSIGEAFIIAADEISLNISAVSAFKKKKKQLSQLQKAVAQQAKCSDLTEKARHRDLITVEQYDIIFAENKKVSKKIKKLKKELA